MNQATENIGNIRGYGGEFYRHSRRVRKLKIVMISLTSLIILAVIVWPLTNMGQNSFKLGLENNNQVSSTDATNMIKPRFHGLDKNKQPFNVTADSATQKDTENVLLDNINADILLKDGDWMSLLSKTGTYNIKRKHIDLKGKVNLLINNGYEINTESAYIDLNENIASGNETVTVHGPLGNMTAQGFIVRDNGRSIMFHGGVKLITKPPSEMGKQQKTTKG